MHHITSESLIRTWLHSLTYPESLQAWFQHKMYACTQAEWSQCLPPKHWPGKVLRSCDMQRLRWSRSEPRCMAALHMGSHPSTSQDCWTPGARTAWPGQQTVAHTSTLNISSAVDTKDLGVLRKQSVQTRNPAFLCKHEKGVRCVCQAKCPVKLCRI